jgi:hypothetical protein
MAAALLPITFKDTALCPKVHYFIALAQNKSNEEIPLYSVSCGVQDNNKGIAPLSFLHGCRKRRLED